MYNRVKKIQGCGCHRDLKPVSVSYTSHKCTYIADNQGLLHTIYLIQKFQHECVGAKKAKRVKLQYCPGAAPCKRIKRLLWILEDCSHVHQELQQPKATFS